MTVRRADLTDSPVLAGLRWAWATEQHTPPMSRAEFEAHFDDWFRAHEHSHVPFLAHLDGAPVGMAWLALLPRVPDPMATDRVGGDLQSVYVLPEHRSEGIGEQLVAVVLDLWRAEQLEKITVSSSTRAVPLYQRSGFRQLPTVLAQEP